MYEVGSTYGWRVSEVKGLRVRQVDSAAYTIRLDPGTTKNGKGRLVTFERDSALCQLLAMCVHGKSADDYMFTRDDGKAVRDFRGTWAKVTKAAGVAGILFHDLRRTAARNLRRAGIAENVIMQIGGWRTHSVFDRYAIVAEDDMADAMHQLDTYRKEREVIAAEIAALEGSRSEISHVSVTESTQVPTRVANAKLLN